MLAFALAGLAFGLSIACKWSGLFPLAVAIGIIGMVRLLQGWRTHIRRRQRRDWYRPDLWPGFRYYHAAACFMLIPALVYLATFVPLYGLSLTDILEAQRKIFSENTTTSIADHPYMSAWPSWPLLVRPVWYLFEKVGDNLFQAIIFLGNPLVLWPAVAALGLCLLRLDREASRRCVPDSGVLSRTLARMGDADAKNQFPVLLSAIGHGCEPCAGLCADARQRPRWLLWGYVAIAALGFIVMLPITVATLGTSIETYRRLMIFKSWI